MKNKICCCYSVYIFIMKAFLQFVKNAYCIGIVKQMVLLHEVDLLRVCINNKQKQ